ncbi:excinuclease ABC subunit UvrC [Clostridium botulinum]|uniref:UvrABC system protein C n=1 Tax=Clostridium botulinum (strain Langeland / NCTC 10281 / Type F) TaxID=441772 RepID=UVRC_CLOBL|nr:excinuclease ABC subunit UvrC [Clostridium botulinum]A7GIX6.1 RecName: Full=UvrABC system protein C; Short=Protein UvrC; AltName: Full=Excinuclease ABC subunit C [Clostridium botulinum F str. Langeland]ABS39516.1 excinuclease ABC, C subunit [Clostridium botulinum F str. Langeland]ADG01095.1 excinuclease ABC, C subunit [Clostridium botulinum F str. 230613]KKM42031.1 excinuclease ABC subunit C [Clostridium botulinum]MBY6793647.1 excinuclease ABC subunit UvrC [Clostridium botulinum]MBY6938778
MFDLEYQLKNLPDKPGVYLMKNNLGEIIYVGKAKILKNRVRQYFQKSQKHSEKVKAMVKNIEEFEYIITDSEIEALILECNLIKKYRPKYNILLKDDKHYPFIKVTLAEDFPRVVSTRKVTKDGSKYFGPYVDGSSVKDIIELIKKTFPIRTCKKNIVEGAKAIRPCLNYQIGLCKAPCAQYIKKSEYREIIDDVIKLLSGKHLDIVENFKLNMERAAENLEFEKAAMLRDKINIIEKIGEKQKIILNNFDNEDYISLYSDGKDTCFQVFFLRNGKIVGREHFIIEDTFDTNSSTLISNFLKEFYGGTAYIPKTIYVPNIEDEALLEQWLTLKKESKSTIKIPIKGEKKNILVLVEKNAKTTLENFKLKYLQEKALYDNVLKDLKNILRLQEEPIRIEAFDISNIQGFDSVGSMVVFEKGRAKPSDYRRFKINTVKGADDYKSMKEILTRRFQHGLSEIKSIQDRKLEFSSGKFSVFPDLILMDGGKGQINIALEVLNTFNIDIPVCGMVKDNKHRTRGLIYNGEEIIINKYGSVMKFITRVQDEVHRFAISYHRSLRGKNSFHSLLDDIPNIGEKRKKDLLFNFKSIDNIKKATYEELLSIPSMDKKSAECVLEFFK